MPQDKNRKSDNRTCRKSRNAPAMQTKSRSGNFIKHRNRDYLSVPESSENIYSLDIGKASENDKKEFKDLTEKGIVHDSTADTVNIGLKNERGRHMIVNPALEKKRMLLRKLDFVCIAVMIAAVLSAAIFASINIILDSDAADKMFFGKSPHISDDGNYIFGDFDGYVTVGDTLETAFEILGLPDSYNAESNLYYYGYSYIIVDNDTVVGYYNDKSNEFHVTVGYKNPGTTSAIGIGDSAPRVVKKLGSPEYYLKRRWIYKDMNEKFEKSSYSAGSELVINFDENYTVSGYEFIK